MFNQKNKVTRADYEQWRAGQDETAARIASDPDRLLFHVEPELGWLNDPNGLVQIGDTYHIYHQYDPFDAAHGGPVLWNHLTTKDFVTYENHGPVLFPDSDLDSSGAYSGSAFVRDGKIHYFYTGNVKHFDRDDYDYVLTGREQNQIHVVAENPDELGEKRIAVGPVDYPDDIGTHVRDPKILEHDGIYYMVLGARTKDDRGCVLVYTSRNLEDWSYATRIELGEKFGFMWECPGYLELEADGGVPAKWLSFSPQGLEGGRWDRGNVYAAGYMPVTGDITGGDSAYDLGEFHLWDAGFDFYAPQEFASEDGRHILIGWMGMPDADYGNAPTVAHGWQHCFTVPRLLTKGENGTLLQTPVPELDARRSAAALTLRNGEEASLSPCFDLTAAPAGDFALTVAHGVELVYTEQDSTCVLQFTDPAQASGRTQRRTKLSAPCRSVRVVGDRSSLEIFLNDGAAVFSTRYYPAAGDVAVKISGTDALVYSL